MAETFKSAMREYAPVTVGLGIADVIASAWFAVRKPADVGASHLAVFVWTVVVLWTMTLVLWLIFAAKDVLVAHLFAHGPKGGGGGGGGGFHPEGAQGDTK